MDKIKTKHSIIRCQTVTHSSIAHLTDAHCNLPPLFKPTFAHWDNSSPDDRSHLCRVCDCDNWSPDKCPPRQMATMTIGHSTIATIAHQQILTDNSSPDNQPLDSCSPANRPLDSCSPDNRPLLICHPICCEIKVSSFRFQEWKKLRIYWPFLKLWKMRRCLLLRWTLA